MVVMVMPQGVYFATFVKLRCPGWKLPRGEGISTDDAVHFGLGFRAIVSAGNDQRIDGILPHRYLLKAGPRVVFTCEEKMGRGAGDCDTGSRGHTPADLRKKPGMVAHLYCCQRDKPPQGSGAHLLDFPRIRGPPWGRCALCAPRFHPRA